MRAYAFVLAAALAAASCGASDQAAGLPDVRLPTLGGPLGPSLASCATEKCLTVLVAPWCGVCHQVTPDIVRLRRFLDKAGVSSRVVVGLDELEALKGMAALYGSDAMLDASGAMKARGVPLFIVSNRAGEVVKRVNGFPRGASSPDELAAYFGLP
ncbi:MAG: hypothetical protein Q8T11_17965 [Elusimicrobiota bacterium]|nr:hypothetical protein [Elusimicrobiota bacterium]